MTKPLTPSDVERVKTERLRPEMIEAANELIAERWDGYSSRFTLYDLGALARKKLDMHEKDQFRPGELDIEPVFERAGWSVKFDRPGFNEFYDAYFVFTKKRVRGADK